MLELGIRCICWLTTDAMIDFPVAVSLVTVVGEMLWERKQILPLRHISEPGSESVNPGGTWAKAHHQTRARRIAERRLRMGIGKERSASSKLVDVRRLNQWMPIHTANPIVLIINSDEENIGLMGET